MVCAKASIVEAASMLNSARANSDLSNDFNDDVDNDIDNDIDNNFIESPVRVWFVKNNHGQ